MYPDNMRKTYFINEVRFEKGNGALLYAGKWNEDSRRPEEEKVPSYAGRFTLQMAHMRERHLKAVSMKKT